MSFFAKVKDFLSKSLARKIIAIALCVVVVGGAATGIILGVSSCGGSSASSESESESTSGYDKYYDNEEDALRFSTLEVDGVFNPFFSTSGTDGSVVGMTQLALLGNDENGEVTYGDDQEVIAKDFITVHEKDESGEIKYTTYYFVLKNDVRFSNGSHLTMKDVLFNFYVYLDPVYSGSSTMYSTDIVGLKEFRTQEEDAGEQENFMDQFRDKAYDRRTAFVEAYYDIKDNVLSGRDYFTNEKELKDELKKYAENDTTAERVYANLVGDYEKIAKYFDEELQSDYNTSKGGYADLKFYKKEKDGSKTESSIKLTSDVEMFFYNEGQISYNEKDDKIDYGDVTPAAVEKLIELEKSSNEDDNKKAIEEAIDIVRRTWIPNKVDQIAEGWAATSSNFITYLTNDELKNYYQQSGDKKFPDIKGIRFANKDEAITIVDDDGKEHTYAKPVYHDNDTRDYVVEGNEVLSIKINKVDPKAKWNFGIGIAPMYYYSNAEQIKKFDYEKHFGVDYGNSDFFNDVLNNSYKNGVPVGAGAYAAANGSSGGGLLKSATNSELDLTQVEKDKGEFRSKGIIYYERNPYYNMAPNKNADGSWWTKTAPDGNEYRVAKIKKVRYVVLSTNSMTNSLYTNAVDFIEPNAKKKIMDDISDNGYESQNVTTNGYGYIGINAGKVPSVYVRRAIMHAVNTTECVNYYGSMAKSINRPMSTTSWAYPKDTIPYYPYIAGKIPAQLLETNAGGDYKYSVYEDYRKFIEKVIAAGDFTKADVGKGTVTLSRERQIEYIKSLVEDKGGYRINASSGVYTKEGNGKSDELKYTFTVAGESTDHPAFTAMDNAKKYLNDIVGGFSITVKNDKDALSLLATGGLTVWAAAWGSTIDPDMYQVYHKDSKATSVLNWGYREILNDNMGKYNTEKSIVGKLSDLIDEARESEDIDERQPSYKKALDLVMELAVELPTYQRDDLFAYNQKRIDTSTFFADPQPIKGLTSTLTSMSLIVER